MCRSITLFLFALISIVVGKQLSAQSISELRLLIDSGRYDKALPIAQRLVAKNPKHADNNYMLGLLLYKAERYEEAIAPLRVAVSRRSDAYEMLADAYAKEYFFSEALAALEKQKVALVKKKQETVSIDARIDRMRRAVRLLDRAEWVEVIDSVRTNKADLLSAYNLIADNGRLEWVKGNQGEATSFVNGRGDHAIMTEKGEDGVYSLHEAHRIGGKWGNAIPLEKLNSRFNENYPSLRADGFTLLFASDRPDGIGGYDLYMTRRDLEDGIFLEPTLLGMPFNSPYNDYLLVYDELRGIGFFASDRFCPADVVTVYTFVINEEGRPVATDDMALKRAYASLKSIRATQDPERDYSRLIASARDSRTDAEKKASERQIYFPMQGMRIYTRWSDFQSSEAKSLYQDVMARKRKLEQAATRLEELRLLYGRASASERSSMKQEILRLENAIPPLEEEVGRMEKEVRNIELQAVQGF